MAYCALRPKRSFIVILIFASFMYLGFTAFMLLESRVNYMEAPHFSVHNDTQGTTDDHLSAIAKQVPTIPAIYLTSHSRRPISFNKTCAHMPSLYDLSFNNVYWQVLRSSNGSFYIYGAYIDVREKTHRMRLLVMVDRVEPNVKLNCQFWYENKVGLSAVEKMNYIWVREWGNYKDGKLQPFLLTCDLPDVYEKIEAVSLVENACDTATNSIKVHFNKPEEKKGFAVCVKGLDFSQDLTLRLVEWIEAIRILGADKIFFYLFNAHDNVKKLLNYYTDSVEVTEITIPGDQPNIPLLRHLYFKNRLINKRQNELIAYNDCFHKHLYEYKYIALLDIDELILPRNAQNWSELMNQVELNAAGKKVASYNFRNVYYFDVDSEEHVWYDDIPKHLHMLQHVTRSANFTKPGQYIKSFHNTEKVLTLHNHYPRSCLGSCDKHEVNMAEAQMNHYRDDCVGELKKSCSEYKNYTVVDTLLWKYKDDLIARVTKTLRDLNYYDD